MQWGELDAYGHVNNAVFFRYFESARVEYLLRCGFVRSYEESRVGAILHSTACRFRRPLHFPDTVEVSARATSVEADRFAMAYVVRSERIGDVVAEGSGVVVSFDYRSGSKAPLPGPVRDGIAALEGVCRRPTGTSGESGPPRRSK